ncbi:MAG: hypothetical protein LBB44_02810 [Endomicrobium sp.]|nr:hypothetical protein [Endomicrobium sp.]
MKKFSVLFFVVSIVFSCFVSTYAHKQSAKQYHCEKNTTLLELYRDMDSPTISNEEYEEKLNLADKIEKNFKKFKCQEEYYTMSRFTKGCIAFCSVSLGAILLIVSCCIN